MVQELNMNELLRLMIEQNRIREQQVDKLVTKLAEKLFYTVTTSMCFLPNLD